MPAAGEDVLYKSVSELGALLRAKKVTSVELTEGYIARLEEHGAKLGAVAVITRERALAEARQADKELAAGKIRGPLHGIPYGLKDLLAARGYPTTWGAPQFKEQTFPEDATVTRKLREAGAVLVAKLAMIELAGGGGYNSPGASLQGVSRCPFNPDYWAGGSSSGPGAAVPAALVGFAIGSETLGSIITPCAFSGVSGLRPTYGRVSRAGAMALSWTMDKLGPMCRSAEDCGIVLAAIAGRDEADPSSHENGAYSARPLPIRRPPPGTFTAAIWQPLKGKRIGVLRPPFAQPGMTAPGAGDFQVGKAYGEALDSLRSIGASLEDTALPDFPYGAVAVTLYTCEAASIFRPFIESGKVMEFVDEPQALGLVAALQMKATDYLDAFRLRVEIQKALGALFEKFDVIVAPSRNGPAPLTTAELNPMRPPAQRAPEGTPPPAKAERPPTPPGVGNATNIIGASNIAGLPALSVPCGYTPDKNLPMGIQFVADAMRDDVCVECAMAYQSVTDFHTKRPKLG